MHFSNLILLSVLATTGFSAPAVGEKRQDKTFTITCIGKDCPDYPPTTLSIPSVLPSIPGIPGVPGRPTTVKTTSAKTTSTKPTTAPSTRKTTTSTSKYTPPPTTTTKKTSTNRPPTTTTTGEETGPSSTRCPVPLYYKCGGWDNGKPWAGCTECVKGAVCVVQNEWYSQCVAEEDSV